MKVLAVMVACAAMLLPSFAKHETQVADLVKKNLNSIGTEEARATVKTRIVEGTLIFDVPNSKTSRQDGKEVYVSEGPELVSLLELPNPTYHGERFVSDGSKALITMIKPGIYSSLGTFLLVHNEILTQGLWGGELSTGWALAHLDERLAKLQDRGLKKNRWAGTSSHGLSP
jgi:hypothetical protein